MLSAETWLNGKVSTHSRAEAAATYFLLPMLPIDVSTHSRAEAAAVVTSDCTC